MRTSCLLPILLLAIFFTPTVQQTFPSEKLLKRTCEIPEVLSRKNIVKPCPYDSINPVKIENVMLHSKICEDGRVLVKLHLMNPGDDIHDVDITASVKYFGFVKKENKCDWKTGKQFKKNLDVASFQVVKSGSSSKSLTIDLQQYSKKALPKQREAYAIDLYLTSKPRPYAILACVHLEFSLYDFLE